MFTTPCVSLMESPTRKVSGYSAPVLLSLRNTIVTTLNPKPFKLRGTQPMIRATFFSVAEASSSILAWCSQPPRRVGCVIPGLERPRSLDRKPVAAVVL